MTFIHCFSSHRKNPKNLGFQSSNKGRSAGVAHYWQQQREMEDGGCQSHPFCKDNSENNSDVDMGKAFTDCSGGTVSRVSTGGWAAAIPILAFEVGERIALYSLSINDITYLTDVLHLSTASAAVNINIWSGTSCVLSLLGAFISDSYLGCYRTVFYSSLVYLVGMVSLTLAAFLPSLRPTPCRMVSEDSKQCKRANMTQLGCFFIPFYLVALGLGGHKPCLQALGAHQFNDHDPKQARQRASFFNWWNCAVNLGLLFSINVFVYVEENISWALGFGIPTVIMATTFCIFLMRTKSYRRNLPKSSPFTQIAKVVIAAFRNRGNSTSVEIFAVNQEHGIGQPLLINQYRFLDRAKMVGDEECTELSVLRDEEVEEVKLVLRLIPIWICTLMYAVVFSESQPFFIKQGKAMDRSIISNFEIPSAALQSFACLSITLFIPIYDGVLVPLARQMTGNIRGITMLQRIGIGLVASTLTMIVAALIEMKRLKLVQQLSLQNEAEATVPMSIMWLLPQHILLGLANVFAMVGISEFFYDQMPESLKSLGMATFVSAVGVGGFLGGFLISIMEWLSSCYGHQSWFDDNMNEARFDNFYWVIAALNALFLCMFLCISRGFVLRDVQSTAT